MSEKRSSTACNKLGFVKTFLLPALWIFAIPLASLFFFDHAESRYDARARESVQQQIRAKKSLSPAERDESLRLTEKVRLSELIQDPKFAATADPTILFHYATFRWMKRIAVACLVVGALVCAVVGVLVLWSLRSQEAQYRSLWLGWHVLRIFAALQTIAIAVLVVALSFWVTALWTQRYYIKLIVIAGLAALAAVAVVLMAVFARPKHESEVEGIELDMAESDAFRSELHRICGKVGADPPDHVVAGIDDSFFVTQMPIKVGERQLEGKTLFVSLALLRHLNGSEAAAVLAHEMAHFSGNDTLYSSKLAPFLLRFDHYLQALWEGGLTKPVYYFMSAFRALFEVSLGQRRRQREFRADAIAAKAVSPKDLASALLRIISFSSYRNSIQAELFEVQQALDTADVAARIERGFGAYAAQFVHGKEIAQFTISHPFDSHPPLNERLGALGFRIEDASTAGLLDKLGDGRWHQLVPNADDLERRQWEEFESRFRAFHKATLPFRLLPSGPAERQLVEETFPPIEIAGNRSTLKLDCEQISLVEWPDSLPFAEVDGLQLQDNGDIVFMSKNPGFNKRMLKLKLFEKEQREVVSTVIQQYVGRYLSARQYHAIRQVSAQGLEKSPSNVGAVPSGVST